MITKGTLLVLISLLFSGCVSVTTGLQIAEFGVKVGFEIHNYAEKKREEAKEIVDANISRP